MNNKLLNLLIILTCGVSVSVLSYCILYRDKDGNDNGHIGVLTTLHMPNRSMDIVSYENRILLQPFEKSENIYTSLSIDDKSYPELFKKGISGLNFLSSKTIRNTEGKYFIELSNNQPEHAVYSPTYKLLVDPATGTITTTKSDLSTHVFR